jgi:hypothetical protein
MPNQSHGQTVPPMIAYLDRPEISEIFADSCFRVSVEGPNVKLIFVVNRMDEPQPPAPISGTAVTASRIVLTLPGMLDLHAKLTQTLATLQAQGVLEPIFAPPTQQSGKPN